MQGLHTHSKQNPIPTRTPLPELFYYPLFVSLPESVKLGIIVFSHRKHVLSPHGL